MTTEELNQMKEYLRDLESYGEPEHLVVKNFSKCIAAIERLMEENSNLLKEVLEKK